MADTAEIPEAGRSSGKSASAFRTISEVADELDIQAHVLRFWETKFPQVKPLKRGGGRRYYRPDDIKLIRRIRDLLYTDGYTIKGVQKLLRDGGLKAILAEPENASMPKPTKTGTDPQSATAPAGLTFDQRKELEAVLGELQQIQAMLKGANA